MSYESYKHKYERMGYTFETMGEVLPVDKGLQGRLVAHCPTGIDLQRATDLDKWTGNYDQENCPLSPKETRESFHNMKRDLYNAEKTGDSEDGDVPIIFSESLRHDMLRSDLLRSIRVELADQKENSKRINYFFSNTIRRQCLFTLCMGTLDNKGVTIGYLSGLYKTARSTVRKVITDSLEAGWITKKCFDGSETYIATDTTVNTYYNRMRRQYSEVSAQSIMRTITYESLCKFEDEFNRKFNQKRK